MKLVYTLRQYCWIWKFLAPYRRRLYLYLFTELVALASSLLFIYFSKLAIDSAVLAQQELLRYYVIGMLLSLGIGVACSLIGNWFNDHLKAKMLFDLQQQLLHAQMQTTWAKAAAFSTGDILHRLQVDSPEAIQVLCSTQISIIVTSLKLLSAFSFLWWMDPTLAFMILGLSPLALFSKIYYKRLKKLNVRLKKEESALSQSMQENIRLRLPIRALNLNLWRKDIVHAQHIAVYKTKLKLLRFSLFSRTVVSFIGNSSFLLAFLWGVHSLYVQEITFGTMSAFLQLVARIQGPILSLMSYVPQLIRFSTSADRLKEVIDVEEEEENPIQIFTKIDAICVKDISFSYQDNKAVLTNFSASFERGKSTAIVGSSGKGKTTLIRILLALLVPKKGNVTIINDGKVFALHGGHRPNFAYVPQGDKLFSGTIRHNLQVNKVHSEMDLRQALHLACADFVLDLPEGLDTKVGEGATSLSEGQAQRIAVARALLSDASVYLFDEVTSALDAATAERLMLSLLEVGKNKILIFITHDMKLGNLCSQKVSIN